MKKLLILSLIFPLLLFSFDYQASWKRVEEFNSQRLPKSALAEVEKIYTNAKSKGDSIQFIKATLYKKNYISTLNEDGEVNAIKSVEKALKEATSSDERAILNSILAQMYSNYLQENYYRIHKRTAIKNSTNSNITNTAINLTKSWAIRYKGKIPKGDIITSFCDHIIFVQCNKLPAR